MTRGQLVLGPDDELIQQRVHNRRTARIIYTLNWLVSSSAISYRHEISEQIGSFLWLLPGQDYSWVIPFSVLFEASVLSRIGAQYQSLADAGDAQLRSQRAEAVRDSLARGDRHDGNVFLFLRPFELEGQLPVPNPRRRFSTPLSPSYYSEPEVIDFEVLIAEALEPSGVTLAIGERLQVLRGSSKVGTAGRLWQDDFRLIAAAASAIVCIPSDSPSSAWEIGQLVASGLIRKTLFIIPPSQRSGLSSLETWERVRNHLEEHAIPVPPYVKRGQLWRLDEAGNLSDVAPLPRVMSVRALRRAILGRLRLNQACVEESTYGPT